MTLQIQNWIVDTISSDRHLWILDKNTGHISWQPRNTYSWWNNTQCCRLQEIFANMEAQLRKADQAQINSKDLCNLNIRITEQYLRYKQIHSTSILGLFYQFLFGRQVDQNYEKLNKIITNLCKPEEKQQADSTVIPEDETIPVKFFEDAQKEFPQKSSFFSKEMEIPDETIIDKAPLAFELNNIIQLINNGSYQEISKINPKDISPSIAARLDINCFKHFTDEQITILDFSCLDEEKIVKLAYSHTFNNIFRMKFQEINLSNCNDKIYKLMNSQYWIIKYFNAKTIAENLHKIPYACYQNMENSQLKYMDANNLTKEQLRWFDGFQRNIILQNSNCKYFNDTLHIKDKNTYYLLIEEAFQVINVPAQSPEKNLKECYISLENRIRHKKNAIKNNPKILFADDENSVNKDSIKGLYHQLILTVHPDKNPNKEKADKIFKLLSLGYQILISIE
jgi:hypothetical protein